MSKILVIGAAWVGDAVLSQPMLAALKQREAGAEIHVLAPPWTHGVLQRMPAVSQVLDSPFRHGELALGARRQLARQLKAAGYGQAVVLPNSFKSALVPWFAGIPRRTGYVGELRQWLLNDARPLDREGLPLMVERFAGLALPAGARLEKPVPRPRLVADLRGQAAALERLGLDLGRPVAVLCPGAEYGPAKRWPVRHFAAAARLLAAQGFQIWLLGSAKDRPVGETLVQEAGTPIRNLCGLTPLAEAVDLMAAARRVISNDSGLMHVAAALDRPLAAVFGSSSPRFTPPLSEQARVVSLNLPCSPCFKRECPLGHLRCLEDLAPETVMQAWKG